ncbi:MAG: hypothetical protein IMY71_11510 [Bacteroidetes bacterium]|nr:hypothetical protein [Bacteroidota bacterium]
MFYLQDKISKTRVCIVESVDRLDKVICSMDKTLAILDEILMDNQSKPLSDAFDLLDRGLTRLSEARFMFGSR